MPLYWIFVYTATDLPFPMDFINLIIFAFSKYGIFLPSTVSSGANNRYIFSCLVSGLYLINGKSCVACTNLKITSIGIFILKSG